MYGCSSGIIFLKPASTLSPLADQARNTVNAAEDTEHQRPVVEQQVRQALNQATERPFDARKIGRRLAGLQTHFASPARSRTLVPASPNSSACVASSGSAVENAAIFAGASGAKVLPASRLIRTLPAEPTSVTAPSAPTPPPSSVTGPEPSAALQVAPASRLTEGLAAQAEDHQSIGFNWQCAEVRTFIRRGPLRSRSGRCRSRSSPVPDSPTMASLPPPNAVIASQMAIVFLPFRRQHPIGPGRATIGGFGDTGHRHRRQSRARHRARRHRAAGSSSAGAKRCSFQVAPPSRVIAIRPSWPTTQPVLSSANDSLFSMVRRKPAARCQVAASSSDSDHVAVLADRNDALAGARGVIQQQAFGRSTSRPGRPPTVAPAEPARRPLQLLRALRPLPVSVRSLALRRPVRRHRAPGPRSIVATGASISSSYSLLKQTGPAGRPVGPGDDCSAVQTLPISERPIRATRPA